MKRLLVQIALLIVLGTLMLSSCGVGHIEDTNGDDISLCSITEEEIFGSGTSSTSQGSVTTQINGKYSFKVNKLSGVYEFESFKKDRGVFEIKASTTLEEGNLRIVVLCDGKYVADIAVKENETVRIDNKVGGKYEIRFAAESAKFNFECVIE